MGLVPSVALAQETAPSSAGVAEREWVIVTASNIPLRRKRDRSGRAIRMTLTLLSGADAKSKPATRRQHFQALPKKCSERSHSIFPLPFRFESLLRSKRSRYSFGT